MFITFEFNDLIYRLELGNDCSSDKHNTMLYKHLYYEQKEYFSQMIEKINSTDKNNGIPADVIDYVINIRPKIKANEDIQTPDLGKAVYEYLTRTKKTKI